MSKGFRPTTAIRTNIPSGRGVVCQALVLTVPSHTAVLVLAGIELIFFTEASMRLRFGFVLKTAMIIQGRFCYCRTTALHHQEASEHVNHIAARRNQIRRLVPAAVRKTAQGSQK